MERGREEEEKGSHCVFFVGFLEAEGDCRVMFFVLLSEGKILGKSL
jgi:hypothetical protein